MSVSNKTLARLVQHVKTQSVVINALGCVNLAMFMILNYTNVKI